MTCSHLDKRSVSGDGGGGGRWSATSTTVSNTGDGVSVGSSDDRGVRSNVQYMPCATQTGPVNFHLIMFHVSNLRQYQCSRQLTAADHVVCQNAFWIQKSLMSEPTPGFFRTGQF